MELGSSCLSIPRFFSSDGHTKIRKRARHIRSFDGIFNNVDAVACPRYSEPEANKLFKNVAIQPRKKWILVYYEDCISCSVNLQCASVICACRVMSSLMEHGSAFFEMMTRRLIQADMGRCNSKKSHTFSVAQEIIYWLLIAVFLRLYR